MGVQRHDGQSLRAYTSMSRSAEQFVTVRSLRSFGRRSDVRTLLALVLIGLVVSPRPLSASKGMMEGAAPLGMDLSVSNVTDANGLWTLSVRTWSKPGLGQKGLVRIKVGSGAVVTEGATEATVSAVSGFWGITLRAIGDQPVRISGTLVIPGQKPNSYYESNDIVVVRVEGQRVVVQEKRTTMTIGVRDGRRMRYGGELLVALDPDESAETPEILSRPRLTTSTDIPCAGCGLTVAKEFTVIVTVGRNGLATWIRPTEVSPDGQVGMAIISGLKDFRFLPAVAQTGAVSDAAVIQVRVVPSD